MGTGGRGEYAHSGDRKCVSFHTINVAYNAVSLTCRLVKAQHSSSVPPICSHICAFPSLFLAYYLWWTQSFLNPNLTFNELPLNSNVTISSDASLLLSKLSLVDNSNCLLVMLKCPNNYMLIVAVAHKPVYTVYRNIVNINNRLNFSMKS